jgi:hypothetical protein
MHEVKSVGVLSVAKLMGLLYGCMGLVFAPFFLLFGLLGSLAGHGNSPLAGVFGIVFAILMPVLYGLALFSPRSGPCSTTFSPSWWEGLNWNWICDRLRLPRPIR